MIAVFGGSFNPPTIAHYEVAEHVMSILEVSKLLFVPVGNQYEKAGLIPAIHRVQMLEIMAKHLPGTSVSHVEIESARALKTIETLETLQAQHPNERLAFLIGADNLYDLPNWYCYEQLITQFKFIVVDRHDLDVCGFIEKKFSNHKENFIVMDDFVKRDISSTQYRVGEKQADILLPAVDAYIKKNKLY